MTSLSQAEDKFKEAADILRKEAETKERNDLLERIIEWAMKMRGVTSATIKE
jgi:hypothetical protein